MLEQREDLILAEKNLRDTIDEIDRTARIRFKKTFEKIRANFENLFQLFFEGGNASIELIENNDPLDSDISIIAQPPGKTKCIFKTTLKWRKSPNCHSIIICYLSSKA